MEHRFILMGFSLGHLIGIFRQFLDSSMPFKLKEKKSGRHNSELFVVYIFAVRVIIR